MGPHPAPIKPGAPWVVILGAVFGALTLIGFFAFAILAGKEPDFICSAFVPIVAIFSFGAALSAGFVGGAAAINGGLGEKGQNNALAFSAGGGIAVLFIAMYVFNSSFKSSVCEHLQQTLSTLSDQVNSQTKQISADTSRIAELSAKLQAAATESDNRIKTFRLQPIKIGIATEQSASTPLRELAVTYIGKDGSQVASRIPGTNVFVIQPADMNDDDRRISLELDPLLSKETGPVSIVIDKISHEIAPLRIDLTLHFVRSGTATQ